MGTISNNHKAYLQYSVSMHHVRIVVYRFIKASFSVCCMNFLKFSNKWHNMKTFINLSHSWSPFFLLTYLYWANKLLWGPVHPFGVFSWENTPQLQENSFVMRHFYNIILVRYNETWWKWYKMTNYYTRCTFECF